MANAQLGTVLRHLRHLTVPDDLGDQQLLQRFTANHDEAAFTMLVQRHGGMVLGVCRRVLVHRQDAEDVFQATFLILVRKAAMIRQQQSLGCWLHQVALHLALRTRAASAKRRHPEQCNRAAPTDDPLADVTWRELRLLLDEELSRLPEQPRQALVACYLEGQTHEEAARQLGWSLGTLRRRLSQGREALRERLVRRGLALSAALVATLAAESAAPAAVPAGLLGPTLRAASALAEGQTTAEIVSAELATLVERGLTSIVATRWKAALALLLVISSVACTAVLVHAAMGNNETDAKPQAVPAERQAAKADVLEVRGRVLDPQGKPVAGARLFLPHRQKQSLGNQEKATVLQRGTTDKDGRFHLKVPRQDAQPGRPVALVAIADGFGLDWLNLPVDKAPGELTFHLVKDVPIRGRLLTTEGKPVVGVTVTVGGLLAFGSLDDLLRIYQREIRHVDEATGASRLAMPLDKVLHVTASDKDGRFEISGAGVERVVGLEVMHPGIAQGHILVLTRPGLDVRPINQAILQNLNARSDMGLPLLHGTSFDYVLEPAHVIEGTIREAGTGKPVAGATVGALGVTTRTDARGHYRLSGMRKAQRCMLEVVSPPDAAFIGRWITVSDVSGLEPAKVDVELKRGVVITGRVLDKMTGKGVESQVRFAPLPENPFAPKEPDVSLYAWADANGRFRLVTIPGPGVLLAQVVGTLLKIDGVPIYPYRRAEFSAEDRKRVKLANDQGSHRAFLVAGGAESLDQSNACKVLDVKKSGEPVSCDLVLDPGKTLTVKLEDPEGKPLTGALVAGVSAMTLRAVPLKSANCPIYALNPEEPRQLEFLHTHRKLAALVTLRGDEQAPVTVRLAPNGGVTGRALDMDGQPVAGAELYPLYPTEVGQQLLRVLDRQSGPQTDKDGRFRLEGLVPGLQFELVLVKGRRPLVPEPKLGAKSVESGRVLELGEFRVKPRK
jgi:RNA polymerase sigma factor (sigma-70 family)